MNSHVGVINNTKCEANLVETLQVSIEKVMHDIST